MAVKLLQVLVLGVIAAAADDDVPVTWVSSPRALLQCQVPDAERVTVRRPPPPLEGEERSRVKPYLWRRNGTELKRSTSGNLDISRRRDPDSEGLYQCAVRHQAGLVLGYPENIKFAYLEKQFSVHPANATAWRGQPYALTCDISSGPPASLSWLRDSMPLPDDSRYHILGNQLIISYVTDEDAGLYRCRATNTNVNKSKTSHGGRLQVEDAPSDLAPAFLPVQHESTITVTRGSRVVLPCPVIGNPKPTLIWELTQSGQRIAELEATDEMLVMPTIELDQEGVYVCRAEGLDHLHKTFQVTLTSPVNITYPPESKQVVRASTVRFNCSASGSPAPKVTWYKDGELLELSGRINVVVLTADDNKFEQLLIRGVTSADAGVYQCFARNSVSVKSSWAALDVSGGAVAAPRGLRCWPVGAQDVAVTWTKVPDLVAYIVQYTTPHGTSLPWQPVKTEDAVIRVKSPLTAHNFQVRAFIGSPNGDKNTASIISDMSESVTCQGQGVHIRLAKVKDDKIMVSWDGFYDEYPRVVQWILQHKAENSSKEHNITLDGHIFNYTLNLHSPKLQVRLLGTRYLPWLHQNLTLVPWTSSSVAGQDPGFGVVRAVPVDVEVTEVNPRNFTVRWRCEEEPTPMTYTFLLCWRKVGGVEGCLISNVTSAQVVGLEPFSQYEVRVKVRLPGQAQGGDFSKPIAVVTPREGQQNFQNLSYKYINSTTVRVSWNSEFSEYVVRYTDEYSQPRSQWTSVDATGNTILLSGIDPTKNLFVAVEGSDYSRQLPFRYSSLLEIPAFMPEAKGLSYQYTSRGILVTWTGGGPRVVRYSQNLTQPVETWSTIDVLSPTSDSVEITDVEGARPTFVMVAAPAPSARSQVLNIGPRPPDHSKLYLDLDSKVVYSPALGAACGVAALVVLAAVAVCLWRKRKRSRSPVSGRRRSSHDAKEEGSEMRNVGVRLANGGGSKEAGEPLLNGHVNITENPTQSKTPNGKLVKGQRFEAAFDVTRYDDPDATMETVVDPDTSTSTAYFLDTSRKPEYDTDITANDSFNKLPDDNMNSELTRSDFQIENSKVLPTLQPNG